MSNLGKYLDVPEYFWDEVDDWEIESDTGMSGDMDYSYYLYVPEDASKELLETMGWSVGQCINDIPTSIFDSDD